MPLFITFLQMDAEYLKRTLGDVLIEGLKETAIEDPADPIDYLARWLLHHRDVEDQWAEFRENNKTLVQDRAQYIASLEDEYKQLEEERKRKEEEEQKLAEERKKLEEEMAKKKDEEEEEEQQPQSTEDPEASTVYSESLGETY